MRTNHTDITILLDRSGSMASIAADTIGGFNTFLKDQKEAAGTAEISLYQFDHEFETNYVGKDIQEAEELTSKTFVPRGSTALLDAIGRAIVETGERLSKNPAEKVVFVIITDGGENASREYTRDKIFAMITEQKNSWAWQFVFLAANQDAISVGSSFGINAGNSMTYAANSVGTTMAFSSVSKNLSSMRCGTKVDMSYEASDYKAQEDAGVTK